MHAIPDFFTLESRHNFRTFFKIFLIEFQIAIEAQSTQEVRVF